MLDLVQFWSWDISLFMKEIRKLKKQQKRKYWKQNRISLKIAKKSTYHFVTLTWRNLLKYWDSYNRWIHLKSYSNLLCKICNVYTIISKYCYFLNFKTRYVIQKLFPCCVEKNAFVLNVIHTHDTISGVPKECGLSKILERRAEYHCFSPTLIRSSKSGPRNTLGTALNWTILDQDKLECICLSSTCEILIATYGRIPIIQSKGGKW